MIGRLLRPLVAVALPGELDVIVVANGCTDDTAQVAASFGPPVRVLSIPVASKRRRWWPRPRRHGFPACTSTPTWNWWRPTSRRCVRHCSIRARWPAARPGAGDGRAAVAGPLVLRVWARLPEVRSGLFGRGVIGVSEKGHERLASLPPLLADDLAASLVFAPDERVIVPGARVVVHPPRTAGDLLRRRVRATMGVSQVEQAEGAPVPPPRRHGRGRGTCLRSSARTPGWRRGSPPSSGVTLVARLRARHAVRRRGYSDWLRDESSRNG